MCGFTLTRVTTEFPEVSDVWRRIQIDHSLKKKLVQIMKLDWDLLSDRDFESLCYDILALNGFQNIEWVGRHGNDRQRDIKCSKPAMTLGITIHESYIVQCKKWVKRPPKISELNRTLAWADVYKPDVLLFMISNTLTSNTRDWISKIRVEKNYRIILYEEKNFETYLENTPDLFEKYFEKKTEDCSNYEDNLIIEKLLITLAEKSNLTEDEISKEICILTSKTKNVLNSLLDSGFLLSFKNQENEVYSLKCDIPAFIKVAEKVLQGSFRFNFLISPFAQRVLNDDFVKYVEDKFFISFSEQQKKATLLILKIAPKALSHVLFSSNKLYETGFRQMQKLNLEQKEFEKWKASYVTSFISDLLEKLLEDLHHPDCKKTLEQEKIEGYTVGIILKMANIEKPMLTLSAKSAILRLKAKGKVDAGELLSPTTPDLFLQTGGILLNLELYERAILDYNMAITNITEKEKLKIAWNNKGLCLLRLKKPEEAKPCFDEALKIDPNLTIAKKNKALCLAMINAQKSVSSSDSPIQ